MQCPWIVTRQSGLHVDSEGVGTMIGRAQQAHISEVNANSFCMAQSMYGYISLVPRPSLHIEY